MRKQPLVLLRSGRLRDTPHHFMRRMRPEDNLLFWVIGGKGFAETSSQRVDVTKGHLVCFMQGRLHAYGSDADQPWEILWTHFDGPASRRVVQEIHSHGSPAAKLPFDSRLKHRFEEMITIHGQATDASDELASHLLWGVLGLILHTMRYTTSGPTPQKLRAIEVVQQYVAQHLGGIITVDDLADVASLSTRQLTRVMQQATGMAPMQYVIRQRLEHAATLLLQTDLTIQQIAANVGYPNEFHFSRLHTKHIGCSPSDLRRQRKRPPPFVSAAPSNTS